MSDPSVLRAAGAPAALIVIGASAGGVQTLCGVVAGLPPDLRAAICVVLHLAPGSPSALPAILGRAGPLPCRPVHERERLREGEILVAPPDRHAVIEDAHVALSHGPRENGHRPSVDALFRSAAESLDGRVIGVVLSGTRDDGTAGLAAIKAHGGLAIVQDPEEAIYGGMPRSAIAHVAVDAVLPSAEIPGALARMVDGAYASGTDPRPDAPDPGGEPVTTTCPECGGVLSEYRRAGLTQWQCKVGHRYSPETLIDAQAEGVEGTIWAAVRALEDRRALLERIAEQSELRGATAAGRVFRERAAQAGAQVQAVRHALELSLDGTLRLLDQDIADGPDAHGRARG